MFQDWRVNVLGKIKSRKIFIINKVEAKMIKYMKEKNIKQWMCPSAVLAAYYLKAYPLPIKPRIRVPNRKIHKKSSDNTGPLRPPMMSTKEFQSTLINNFK